jgi:hypothetical protein
MAEVVSQPWRCGSQVGRTLYVDHGQDKDPSYLFGLVDDPAIARHIVDVHNFWLDLQREADEAWTRWQAEQ